jgi:hypothetical protein
MMMQIMDLELEMEDELDVECERCLGIMSAEEGSECPSEKCEAFRAFADANQDDGELLEAQLP